MRLPTTFVNRRAKPAIMLLMISTTTLISCGTVSGTISGNATANAICDQWNESLLAWEQTATTEQLEDLFVESGAWQSVCGDH